MRTMRTCELAKLVLLLDLSHCVFCGACGLGAAALQRKRTRLTWQHLQPQAPGSLNGLPYLDQAHMFVSNAAPFGEGEGVVL